MSLFNRLIEGANKRLLLELQQELYDNDYLELNNVSIKENGDLGEVIAAIDIDKKPNIKFFIWYDKQDKQYVLTRSRFDMEIHGRSHTFNDIIDRIKTLDPASAPYFK